MLGAACTIMRSVRVKYFNLIFNAICHIWLNFPSSIRTTFVRARFFSHLSGCWSFYCHCASTIAAACVCLFYNNEVKKQSEWQNNSQKATHHLPCKWIAIKEISLQNLWCMQILCTKCVRLNRSFDIKEVRYLLATLVFNYIFVCVSHCLIRYPLFTFMNVIEI